LIEKQARTTRRGRRLSRAIHGCLFLAASKLWLRFRISWFLRELLVEFVFVSLTSLKSRT
jgi:hypothetical protein